MPPSGETLTSLVVQSVQTEDLWCADVLLIQELPFLPLDLYKLICLGIPFNIDIHLPGSFLVMPS